MQFGIQFFPDVGPETKAADRYFAECLQLVSLCDELGFTHVRTAEQIAAYDELVGGFEIASLQVNFNDVAVADAERSMRLFAEQVMPAVAGA